jgi:hypothetical protein
MAALNIQMLRCYSSLGKEYLGAQHELMADDTKVWDRKITECLGRLLSFNTLVGCS